MHISVICTLVPPLRKTSRAEQTDINNGCGRNFQLFLEKIYKVLPAAIAFKKRTRCLMKIFLFRLQKTSLVTLKSVFTSPFPPTRRVRSEGENFSALVLKDHHLNNWTMRGIASRNPHCWEGELCQLITSQWASGRKWFAFTYGRVPWRCLISGKPGKRGRMGFNNII